MAGNLLKTIDRNQTALYNESDRICFDENTGCYRFNAQGDVVAVVDTAGEIVTEYSYDPFGKLEDDENEWLKILFGIYVEDSNPFRYCAEYYDSETEFIYLRARYYSPDLQRFISEDPIKYGYNWYTYCGNCSVNFIDPSGLKEVWLREWVESKGGTVNPIQAQSPSLKPSDILEHVWFRPWIKDSFNPNHSSFTMRKSGLKQIEVTLNGVTKTYTSADYTIKDDLAYIDDSVLINDFNIDVSTSDTRLPFESFIDAIGFMESSNNYQAVNAWNYLGRFQFGTLALQDIGYKDQNGNWTNTANALGIYSDQDFLNNSNVQDQAMNALLKKNWGYITYYKLDEYVGTTMNDITITESGLLAAAHLVGVGGLRKALNSGDLSGAADGNGTTALKYMTKFGGYNIDQIK